MAYSVSRASLDVWGCMPKAAFVRSSSPQCLLKCATSASAAWRSIYADGAREQLDHTLECNWTTPSSAQALVHESEFGDLALEGVVQSRSDLAGESALA